MDGVVRLVKRVSAAPCLEGQTWGQRDDRVWVTRGCRARFEVVRGGGGGSGQTVDCVSQNGRYAECAIRPGYQGRLLRDYSGRCRKDSTWGNRAGVLWVTSGCQGSFQLVKAGGGSGDGNAGQQQRAEVQCGNQARRQGIEVRRVASARQHGSYWEATIEGMHRGNGPVQSAHCRYRLGGSRAELEVRSPQPR